MKFITLYLSFENFMLPCLNKKLFGIDCPGCGIQRSLAFIVKGELVAAFKMYPAIYTLLFMGAFALLNIKIKFKNSHKIMLTLAIINVSIIIISYIIKMNSIIN